MIKRRAKQTGFTIVELLIVIVVIGTLAAITIVAYNGIQTRTKNVSTQSAIAQVQKLVEAYAAQTGSYPSTGHLNNIYTDSNCTLGTDTSGGLKTAAWVPGLSAIGTSSLPQSSHAGSGRASGVGGCFAYSSDGTSYIITAWNGKYGGPSKDSLYRRLGFREAGMFGDNYYACNHINIGGGSTYDTANDYYKHSYTISNITTCDETPPAGA